MVQKLGWRSGAGLVAANMIGAGVFLSAGFMAQSMTPGAILLAWVVGAFMALAGVKTYSEVVRLVPRSGGEYRYLSELAHPALGYLAGWASLLLGFSAPIAIDAVAAAKFGIGDILPYPRLLASLLVVAITAFHMASLKSSKLGQNILVLLKAALLLSFIVLGLSLGSSSFPTWTPPTSEGTPLQAFMGSLFFIAFAFSGWNAACYAAEDFEDPIRDVPRAMFFGCGLVAIAYLLVNWIIVANITPQSAQAVFAYDSEGTTVAHVVATNLIGSSGARIVSVSIGLLFLSAISAMVYIGPRVYSAMAKDGFLPKAFAGKEGKPPTLSLALQAVIAITLIYVQSLRSILANVGGMLVLFSGLVALAILWRFVSPPRALDGNQQSSAEQVSRFGALSALLYASASGLMLYYALTRMDSGLFLWLALIAAVALVAFLITRFFSTPRT